MAVEERASISYINESFMLWSDLNNAIMNERRQQFEDSFEDEVTKSEKAQTLDHPEQIQCSLDAFVEMWKIVIERSVLDKIPDFKKIKADPLELSINLSEELDNDQDISRQFQPIYKFRNNAEDFFIMCYTVLGKD